MIHYKFIDIIQNWENGRQTNERRKEGEEPKTPKYGRKITVEVQGQLAAEHPGHANGIKESGLAC